MKTVYVSHSTKMDFQNDLYSPLRKISGVQFIFPHQEQREPESSKEKIKRCALLIAEVSVSSVSVGIEVGWADAFAVPVIFLIKRGKRVPLSLKVVSGNIIEYDNLENEISKLEDLINGLTK